MQQFRREFALQFSENSNQQTNWILLLRVERASERKHDYLPLSLLGIFFHSVCVCSYDLGPTSPTSNNIRKEKISRDSENNSITITKKKCNKTPARSGSINVIIISKKLRTKVIVL